MVTTVMMVIMVTDGHRRSWTVKTSILGTTEKHVVGSIPAQEIADVLVQPHLPHMQVRVPKRRLEANVMALQ